MNYLLRVPMGASFAVSLALEVTRAVLNQERMPAPARFADLVCKQLTSSGCRLPYIYDIKYVEKSKKIVKKCTKRIHERLKRSHLHVEEDKKNWADGNSSETAYGLVWWPDEVLTVKAETLVRLYDEKISIHIRGADLPK